MITLLMLLLLQQQDEGPDAYGFDPGAAAEGRRQEPDEPHGMQERQEEPPGPAEPEKTSDWIAEWFPDEAIYRNYVADPLSPRSGTKLMFPFLHKGQNIKIENSLGSQRTIWRSIAPDGREGIDIGVEGAVISRFDLNEDWDMDAADYRFGFPIGYRSGDWSFKLHPWHLTSHLGDELISRTGAQAIRYHKDELALGAAYDVTPDVRIYGDLGYGFYIGTPNKRWRLEAGAEWVGDVFWTGPPRTFVAVDIKWRQETDWDWAVAVQSGFWLVRESATATAGLRVLAEYYYGKAAQTQFPEEHNSYWAVGFAAGF